MKSDSNGCWRASSRLGVHVRSRVLFFDIQQVTRSYVIKIICKLRMLSFVIDECIWLLLVFILI